MIYCDKCHTHVSGNSGMIRCGPCSPPGEATTFNAITDEIAHLKFHLLILAKAELARQAEGYNLDRMCITDMGDAFDYEGGSDDNPENLPGIKALIELMYEHWDGNVPFEDIWTKEKGWAWD
jgi:hypothetical protein